MRYIFIYFLIVCTVAKPLLLETKRHNSGVSRYSTTALNSSDKGSSANIVTLERQSGYYSVDIELGTPAQSLTLLLDTGSSDFWCFTNIQDNNWCLQNESRLIDDSYKINCTTNITTFNYKESSSFVKNATRYSMDFYIEYESSTFAAGYWGTDDLSLGGVKLNSVSVALVEQGNSSVSILGLGRMRGESSNWYYSYPTSTGIPTVLDGPRSANSVNPYSYRNVPAEMYYSGAIESYTYSLWLNDPHASTGNLLFGGVDHAKYEGELTTLPMVTSDSFKVVLNSIGIVDESGNEYVIEDMPFNVLLDSGTTLTLLPKSVLNAIVKTIGYKYDQNLDIYYGPCAIVGDGIPAIAYNFGGTNVYVNITNMLFVVTYEQTTVPLTDLHGNTICQLLADQTDGSFILGDSFLSSAYVVYDLGKSEISIAQTKFNATESDIQPILYNSTVPGANYGSDIQSQDPDVAELLSSTAGDVLVPTGLEFTTVDFSVITSIFESEATGTAMSYPSSTKKSKKNSGDKSIVPPCRLALVSVFVIVSGLFLC